jgi:hypothetical protein
MCRDHIRLMSSSILNTTEQRIFRLLFSTHFNPLSHSLTHSLLKELMIWISKMAVLNDDDENHFVVTTKEGSILKWKVLESHKSHQIWEWKIHSIFSRPRFSFFWLLWRSSHLKREKCFLGRLTIFHAFHNSYLRKI